MFIFIYLNLCLYNHFKSEILYVYYDIFFFISQIIAFIFFKLFKFIIFPEVSYTKKYITEDFTGCWKYKPGFKGTINRSGEKSCLLHFTDDKLLQRFTDSLLPFTVLFEMREKKREKRLVNFKSLGWLALCSFFGNCATIRSYYGTHTAVTSTDTYITQQQKHIFLQQFL